MTTALESQTAVLRFVPEHSQPFLDDYGKGYVIVYFGHVVCPSCHHEVPVQVDEDEQEIGYCPVARCWARLPVAVDPEHLTLRCDDSRPADEHVCICGDSDCVIWAESA